MRRSKLTRVYICLIKLYYSGIRYSPVQKNGNDNKSHSTPLKSQGHTFLCPNLIFDIEMSVSPCLTPTGH